MNKEVEARLKSLQRFDPEHGSDVWFLLALVKRYRKAIKDSISRSDDYADSYCSQPIRQALNYNPEEKAE